jgi:tetratricopeptide (TPR) repeat protein
MRRASPAEDAGFRWGLLVPVGLAALTVAAYAGVWENDFFDFDDRTYVRENPGVHAGLSARGVAWAWTTFHAGYWQPLTWMSLQLDYSLFRLHAPGYHLTNLLLHVVNVLLLFGVLRRMTGDFWPSALAAALFAVHPIHVESVAWVTERKDVLSTFFGLLALRAYAAYAAAPGLGRYLLVALALTCGLMAKPMLVTLPVALLLLDYWPLRRLAPTGLARLLVEKLPLIALAVAFGALTIIAQQEMKAVASLETLPVDARLGNALVSYVRYLGKALWPTHLAPFYPHPLDELPLGQVLGAGALLVVVSVLAVAAARRLPYLAVGWFWFLLTLAPVSGLLQAGGQALADRFAYVPHIGLYVALAWGLRDLLAWRPAIRPAAVVAVLVALTACLVLTRRQVGHWRDSVTLWRHTIAVTEPNAVAHHNLGLALNEQGKRREAMKEFATALKVRPGMPDAHFNLAETLFQEGRLEEAAPHYRAALANAPGMADAHNRLGMISLLRGKADEAVARFRQALEVKPELADAHGNLGVVFLHQGKLAEATEHSRRALELNPDYTKGHHTLALCYLRQGKPEQAAGHLGEVLRAQPRLAEAHNLLGLALGRQGRWAEAASRHRQANELAPREARYRADLAYTLTRLGEKDAARAEYRAASELDRDWPVRANAEAWTLATGDAPGLRDGAEALRLARQVCEAQEPSRAEYLDTLAAALAETGQFDEAAATARKALESAVGQAELVKQLQERLRLYESGKPYHARGAAGEDGR